MLRIGYATGVDCGFVTTDSVGIEAIDKRLDAWPIGQPGAGYDSACDCYCWGYRPRGTPLLGLGAADGFRQTWRICTPGSKAHQRACSNCPTCPKPQMAPPPPPPPTPQQDTGVSAWGVNLGWMLAGVVVAGGGYYAYKKGVFKKTYWRKRR